MNDPNLKLYEACNSTAEYWVAANDLMEAVELLIEHKVLHLKCIGEINERVAGSKLWQRFSLCTKSNVIAQDLKGYGHFRLF